LGVSQSQRSRFPQSRFHSPHVAKALHDEIRRYEAGPAGLKAITALLVRCVCCNRIETRPRDKAIKPLLAAAQELRPRRGAHNPTPLDAHYDALRAAMRQVFHELGALHKY
jgi:hypothetical protein